MIPITCRNMRPMLVAGKHAFVIPQRNQSSFSLFKKHSDSEVDRRLSDFIQSKPELKGSFVIPSEINGDEKAELCKMLKVAPSTPLIQIQEQRLLIEPTVIGWGGEKEVKLGTLIRSDGIEKVAIWVQKGQKISNGFLGLNKDRALIQLTEDIHKIAEKVIQEDQTRAIYGSHPYLESLPLTSPFVFDKQVHRVVQLEAGSLDNFLKGTTTVPKILTILRDAGIGLSVVHDKGYVHNDIKPANILVGMEGQGKLADFGLSGENGKLERGHTVAYVDPSRQFDENGTGILDWRGDIYSLALTLSDTTSFQELYDWDNKDHRIIYQELQAFTSELLAPAKRDQRMNARGFTDVLNDIIRKASDLGFSTIGKIDLKDALLRKQEERHSFVFQCDD